jgi:hypothetical protein
MIISNGIDFKASVSTITSSKISRRVAMVSNYTSVETLSTNFIDQSTISSWTLSSHFFLGGSPGGWKCEGPRRLACVAH